MKFKHRLATAAVAALGLAGMAQAGSYTEVLDTTFPLEENVQDILAMIFADNGWGTPSASTFDSLVGSGGVGPLRSVTTGAYTITRVFDSVDASEKLDLKATNFTTADDSNWTDGTVRSTAEARYASWDQSFGWKDNTTGGTSTTMFDVLGWGFDPGQSDYGPYPVLSTDFEWERSGTGPTWSSDPEDNGGDDHMITFLVEGTGVNPQWLVFWEDAPYGAIDFDFNDLVVQIGVLIVPLPPAAMMGLAGLGGLVLLKRRRTK